MNLVLHIGSPKTGSTAIQRTLAANQPALGQAGWVYPLIDRSQDGALWDRHVGFRIAMSFNVYEPREVTLAGRFGIQSTDDLAAFRRRYEQLLLRRADDRPHAHTMLLSDESLFLFSVRRGLVENIAEFAQHSFDSISVIVYLRDHRNFLRSLYSQRVKAGSGSTFEEFLGEMLDVPLYFSRLKHWRDLLGNDSVQVVPYQRELLCERDVVKDFLGRLSLPALENPWGEMNPSLSDVGCEILRRINERYAQAGEDRPTFFRRLVEAYFSGERPDLDGALYRRYRAGFDEDLNLIVAGLGLSPACADALKSELPPGSSLERRTAGRAYGARALDTQRIADALIEAYADGGAKRNEMSWAEILRLVSRKLRRRMRHA